MEDILKEILLEIRYQTKILEEVFKNRRVDGSTEDHMEQAMNMVSKMPFFRQMGITQSVMQQAIKGKKEPCPKQPSVNIRGKAGR